MRTIQPTPRASIALLLTLIAGCGGGSEGLVQPVSSVPAPPPPPPPPPPFDPCPPPLRGDCIVAIPGGTTQNLPAVDSDYGLVVRAGTGRLGLVENRYRFDGGTVVESGTLGVGTGKNASNWLTVLDSDVTVQTPARLSVVGQIIGNVSNQGRVGLWGTISGNLQNDGTLEATAVAITDVPARINGNFSQSSSGVLDFDLAPGGWNFVQSPLLITGRAQLAGTLQLGEYNDYWGPYPLPDARAHHILHADGGVFGTFERWTSPGLFVEGSLRYGGNDVWFDLNRISVQTAMAASAQPTPAALAGAGALDRSLGLADTYARQPRTDLTPDQQRFLASSTALLFQTDAARAARSLESLGGAVHARLQRDLQDAAADTAARIDAHLGARAPQTTAQGWSAPLAHGGTLVGEDAWLDAGWLAGVAMARGPQAPAPGTQDLVGTVGLYLHRRGDSWQATGLVSHGEATASVDRPIDLDDGARHVARTQRRLRVANVHGELARPLHTRVGHLRPYLALDHAHVDADAFRESGDTGLELVSPGAQLARTTASLGVRYQDQWRIGADGRIGLQVDLRHDRVLDEHGHLQAAFAGTPGVLFDVRDWAQPPGGTRVRWALTGTFDRHWLWSFEGDHAAGDPQGSRWQLALRRPW